MAECKRDLQKDLELCKSVMPGPWEAVQDWYDGPLWFVKGPNGLLAGADRDEQLARFIAEAREGWPEAIKRAMAAEARVADLAQALSDVLSAVVCNECNEDDCDERECECQCHARDHEARLRAWKVLMKAEEGSA